MTNNQTLTFTIHCEKLRRAVPLRTDNWALEQDGPMPTVHFRGRCECGNDHFGRAHVVLGREESTPP